MDDRLLELKNLSGRKDLSLNTTMSDGDDFMPEFSAKIKKAQQNLEKIKDNNQRIIQMQEKYIRATSSQQEKDLSRELDQIMIQNQQYSTQLKDCMQEINKDVEKSKATQVDEPETQMKIQQYAALSTKVTEVLQQTQSVQVNYKGQVREKLTRQTRLLDQSLSEEQIEEICNDPQKAQQLLQEKLYGQASSQLQNSVSDIQDKYKDIQKLEQSVQLVYQLFVDMALLVHQQGLQLDNIELSLGSAKTYVGKAETKLGEAKEDHQAARKKMCCLILVGVIIIAVIVVPVVVTS